MDSPPGHQEWRETSHKRTKLSPQIIPLFLSNGLSVRYLVALLGARSIDASHVKHFMSRIYHYNRKQAINPTMDRENTQRPRVMCPDKDFNPTVMALNDVMMQCMLDNAWYKNLQKGLGLLATNQMLNSGKDTRIWRV